jgi:hypothetical protein
VPATAAMIVPFASVLRTEDGSWKSVVEPKASTLNTEVVATPCVVGDWISSKARFEALEVAAIVRRAVGEVVPMPTFTPENVNLPLEVKPMLCVPSEAF